MSDTRSVARVRSRARVTGVAFFDFLHGQTGVAPNGIELHPILVRLPNQLVRRSRLEPHGFSREWACRQLCPADRFCRRRQQREKV